MSPRPAVAFLLAALAGVAVLGPAGCAKPKDLPDLTVRATSTDELASFRADLAGRFTAEQLQPLDTALDELKLDAMNRGVKTAAERDQAMLATVNGQTVHDALVLGWTARRERIRRETAQMSEQVEYNLKLQAAKGTTLSVSTHLQNLNDILARLHRELAEAEQKLAAWGAKPR